MAKKDKKKPKVEHKDYTNIVDKQKYWNSLVGVYGKGVKGRQNYLDLATKALPNVNVPSNRFSTEYNENFNTPGSPIVTGGTDYSDDYANILQDYTRAKEDAFAGDNFNDRQIYEASLQGLDFTDQYGTQQEAEYLDQIMETGYGKQIEYSNQALNHPDAEYRTNAPQYNNLIEAVTSIGVDNPSLFLASLLDEGGDKAFTDVQDRTTPYSGYDEFGLDRIGERIPEFIEKGYLPKDYMTRVALDKRQNEKSHDITSAKFDTLEDVLLAKKAFFQSGRDVVTQKFKDLGIEPTPKMMDYFTTSTFNLGEGGTRKLMDDYNKQDLFTDDKYLQDDSTSDWREVHRNVTRRMQAADMLVGEGAFDVQIPTSVEEPSGMPSLEQPIEATKYTFGGPAWNYADRLQTPGGFGNRVTNLATQGVDPVSGFAKASAGLSGAMSAASPWIAAANVVGAGLSALSPAYTYNDKSAGAAGFDFESNFTQKVGQKRQETSSKIGAIPIVGGIAKGIFDIFGKKKKASSQDLLQEYAGIAGGEAKKRNVDLYAQAFEDGGGVDANYPHIGEIEVGGTHEQNPKDGVTISPGNLAEQGEYVTNIKGQQFVFTNKF